MKRLVAVAAGEVDWRAIEARMTEFPSVGELVLETSSKQRQLGDCSILVEWLHLGTPGTLRRVAAIEDDLRTLAGVAPTGFDQLVRALALSRKRSGVRIPSGLPMSCVATPETSRRLPLVVARRIEDQLPQRSLRSI